MKLYEVPAVFVGTVSAVWVMIKYWSVCVEFSVFFNMYSTVQEGQAVSSDIFPCELDVTVQSIYMFCEGFYFPCSDLDPGVVHIPEPVVKSSSWYGNQGSALNFFHVEIGHYWGHWWDTAGLLSAPLPCVSWGVHRYMGRLVSGFGEISISSSAINW